MQTWTMFALAILAIEPNDELCAVSVCALELKKKKNRLYYFAIQLDWKPFSFRMMTSITVYVLCTLYTYSLIATHYELQRLSISSFPFILSHIVFGFD